MQDIASTTPRRERLLCLHCSGSSGRQWDRYVAALSRRFEVVAPDLLGSGGPLPWPLSAPLRLDDEVAHVERWLGGAPGGVHLLGHSYGGAVALQLALRWPHRVRSLTLYEPVRFALLFGRPGAAPEGEAIVAVGRRIGAQARQGRLHEAAQTFVDYWSGPGNWLAIEPRRRDALAQRMPKVVSEFEALFADEVPAAAYEALAMPVHLLGGTRSPRPAQLVARLLARLLPRARHQVLPGLGHMAPVTDAASVLARLPHWLQPGAPDDTDAKDAKDAKDGTDPTNAPHRTAAPAAIAAAASAAMTAVAGRVRQTARGRAAADRRLPA
jgi:pimeloyl-ACP methyl ester carboxylesterase